MVPIVETETIKKVLGLKKEETPKEMVEEMFGVSELPNGGNPDSNSKIMDFKTPAKTSQDEDRDHAMEPGLLRPTAAVADENIEAYAHNPIAVAPDGIPVAVAPDGIPVAAAPDMAFAPQAGEFLPPINAPDYQR